MSRKKDFFIILTAAAGILGIMLFNFIIDPYYIFQHKPVYGLNHKKIHMYSNKRQIIFSEMKLNGRNKTDAFIGNCTLYRSRNVPSNIAFYTVPVTNTEEILNIIEHIKLLNPNIKKLYLGINFNEIFKKDRKTDDFKEINSRRISIKDIIDLLFSWNTTKYSIETLTASIAAKNKNDNYVYPYREIAKKRYSSGETCNLMVKLSMLKNFAENSGIKLIFYFTPVHITYKIDIYEKNLWDKYTDFKYRLAQRADYLDYSLNNAYNTEKLDADAVYYIDNIHITDALNEAVISDLLSNSPKIGVPVNKNNADDIIKNDTEYIADYIEKNKELAEKIKSLTVQDADIKIKKAVIGSIKK